MAELRAGSTVGGYKILTMGNVSDILNGLKAIDGAGSGLDSDYLRGIAPSSSLAVNTIVQRDANGHIFVGTVNTNAGVTATTASHYFVETSSDGYIRPKTLANVRTEIVTKAAVEAALTGAITTHTHSYLPLSGGSITGALNSTGTVTAIVNRAYDSSSYSVGNFQANNSSAPSYGFHIPGVVGGCLNMTSSGVLRWNTDTVWHTGNDGSGSGLDADTCDGLHVNTTTVNNLSNQIMRTDTNGYAKFGSVSCEQSETTTAASHYWIQQSSDGFLRPKTLANVQTEIVTKAKIESVLTGTITSHSHAVYYSD